MRSRTFDVQRFVRSVVLCALPAACLTATPAAHAAVTFIEQERYIFESVGKDFFINEATDFSAFNAAFTVTSQTSSMTPLVIAGSGITGPDETFSVNSTTSYFRLVFSVDEPTPFTLTGSLTAGAFGGSGVASLYGSGINPLNIASSGDESFSWNISETLPQGIFELEVFTSNMIGAGGSNWQFTLTLPAPATAVTMAMMIPLIGSRRRR